MKERQLYSMVQPARKVSFRRGVIDRILPIKMNYAIFEKAHTRMDLPPILTMHSINFSRAIFRLTAEHLAEHGNRRVISVDSRNHGQSPHREGHSPAHLAADTKEFMKDHHLERIIAMGHSIGGRGLMTLALGYPELVERAIFVDITPGPMPDNVNNWSKILEDMIKLAPTIPKELGVAEGRKFIEPQFEKYRVKPQVMPRIMHNLTKGPEGNFVWKANLQAMVDSWPALTKKFLKSLRRYKPYKGETLLIAAKRDKFVTPKNITIMEKYFPNLRVEYLDADHTVHLDRPEEFLDLVVQFTRP